MTTKPARRKPEPEAADEPITLHLAGQFDEMVTALLKPVQSPVERKPPQSDDQPPA